ncbi:unnamed protein product [Albugo candida]|uniref:Uncharacterized protein n=1 Tax=Albugo candida TaxID=65357 RepID=A0A024FX19_9STRA|nr:unnamed protein product [Albugo candida]|eukprot:CCI11551.1 unnamed protein product [Albugo candida]
MPVYIEGGTMPIGIETALKRINDEYGNAPNHCKRALLGYVLAVTETEACDPVQVRTRGRPSSSTQRLPSKVEHVSAALDALCIAEDVGNVKRQVTTPEPAVKKQQQHQQHLQQ